MKAPPPSSARLPAVIPAPQMELVRQYEEQIHAAQLEREKRKLQIANLKSELAKRSQSRQAALARRARPTDVACSRGRGFAARRRPSDAGSGLGR